MVIIKKSIESQQVLLELETKLSVILSFFIVTMVMNHHVELKCQKRPTTVKQNTALIRKGPSSDPFVKAFYLKEKNSTFSFRN
jgi:hypothetical protein